MSRQDHQPSEYLTPFQKKVKTSEDNLLKQYNQRITKLKQAEKFARKQTEVLYSGLNALIAEFDLDKFLEQVLIAITEQLAVSSSIVWLYDRETETCFLYMICSQGQILRETQLINFPNNLKLYDIKQHSIRLTEFRFTHSVAIRDIAKSSYLEPSLRDYLMQIGIKEILESPLIIEQEILGYLAAYRTENQEFSSTEIELAQILTHYLSLAIQLTRAAEKVKQEAQQVAVLQERHRIAEELKNSLKHLQEVLVPNKVYPFDDTSYLAEEPTDEHKRLEKPPSGLLALTDREREVLGMIAAGANNKEIAQALYLSEGTVRNYISRILSRLNVRDRTQAALVAYTFSTWLENSKSAN